MSTASSLRKRKLSQSNADESGSLSLELSSVPATQVGPALGVCGLFAPAHVFFPDLLDSASFPSLTPPRDTAFNSFVREEDEGKEFVKRLSTIAGETDVVEFSGYTNEGSDAIGSRFRFLSSFRQNDALTFHRVDTFSHCIDRGRRNLSCTPLPCI
jgi:hypothetical protein